MVEVLAKGIDPETGEVLPQDSPINSPHVIRALFMAAKALEQAADDKPTRAKADSPGNAGKSWTPAEDQQLAQAFDQGRQIAELAKAHQRTAGAIKSRLIRLGRLQESEAGTA
ncbi:MAG: hypothetical protein QM749_08970 [Aquabacterium sp.]